MWRSVAVSIVTIGITGPVGGISPPDGPILAGYDLLYGGDKAGAQRHFEGLLTQKADDPAAGFGLLMAEHARVDVDPAREAPFERSLDAFVDQMDVRASRNRRDGEALFYQAFGHMLRGIYHFEHDKGTFGAARDAAKARDAIDAYLKIDPDNADAYLVRGLYDYFIDIAPTFAHILRFLLALPAGNRVQGLKEIERAAEHGTLFATEAQLELVDIYGALEGRPADAIARGEDLERRYPANDDVEFYLAGFYQSPAVEDREKAAAAYDVVIARRQGGTTLDDVSARYRAILGLAGARFDAWRCDDAIGLLTTPIDAHPTSPIWVLPRFLLRRANYRALMDDPHASADAQRVQSDLGMKMWHKDATKMIETIARHQSSGGAPLYAALVPANRLAAEGRWDEARRAYEAIGRGRPQQDSQVQYRLAYLDFVSGNSEAARPVFAVLAARSRTPDWIRASSWLYVGRIDDLAGRRAEAKKAYEEVVDGYGQERAAEAAKVGLITPYRRAMH